jgi:hypothetical protein
MRVSQKSGFFWATFAYVGTPTTKAVGSKLVTKNKPTALVVGVSKKIKF